MCHRARSARVAWCWTIFESVTCNILSPFFGSMEPIRSNFSEIGHNLRVVLDWHHFEQNKVLKHWRPMILFVYFMKLIHKKKKRTGHMTQTHWTTTARLRNVDAKQQLRWWSRRLAFKNDVITHWPDLNWPDTSSHRVPEYAKMRTTYIREVAQPKRQLPFFCYIWNRREGELLCLPPPLRTSEGLLWWFRY